MDRITARILMEIDDDSLWILMMNMPATDLYVVGGGQLDVAGV
jgi:hypothetical protein